MTWYWQDGILKCRLLDRWEHGFLTKDQTIPGGGLYSKQVHGRHCVYGEACSDQIIEADGLWLDPNSHRSIWVCSADCVPVLVGDRQKGLVSAIHSGWRGTALEIIKAMVTILVDQGANLNDLLVALGPAISGEMYQVGQDVADRVLSTLKTPVGILADELPGHCRLDLRLVQQQQLLELGIPIENISIAPYCTYRSPLLFHSYRRSRQQKDENLGKVQWSGIKAAPLN